MALKKKNKFQQIAAAVKRDLARKKAERNKPKPKGNRTVARPTTTTGSVPKTSLKQRALNVKGKAKSVVRKAKAVVAKVDTKAERSAIAKRVKGKVTKAAKNAKSKAKDIYRKLDTKSERKAALGKAKKAVAKNLKARGNMALNKLTGTGTKGRATALKNFKGKAALARSNTAAKLRGVKVKLQLKKGKLSNAAKNWSQKKKAAMQKLWNRNKK